MYLSSKFLTEKTESKAYSPIINREYPYGSVTPNDLASNEREVVK